MLLVTIYVDTCTMFPGTFGHGLYGLQDSRASSAWVGPGR